MTRPVLPVVLRKVRKLAQLPLEVRQNRFAVSVTRLTVLKNLCHEPEVAIRFVTFLAGKTIERGEQSRGRSAHPVSAAHREHQAMMSDALSAMKTWIREPDDELRQQLRDLLGRMRDEQKVYQRIKWGAVRLITDSKLLLFEYALNCLLNPANEAGHWSYQMARRYAERYDPSRGTGLIPESAPLVQDIADFWIQEVDVGSTPIMALARANEAKEEEPTTRPDKVIAGEKKRIQFTDRQGQFLAFIHLYRKLHHQGPAELDMMKYFRVSPPAVHGMVVKLEQQGLVKRERGVPRSVRVVISEEKIPPLEDRIGPPW